MRTPDPARSTRSDDQSQGDERIAGRSTRLAVVPEPGEKLRPLERLESLCDPGSLQLVRSAVLSRRMGDKTRSGDGVVGAMGRVDGRPVACFAQDPSYLGGSLGKAQADTICRVLEQAGRARVPVVGFIESAGAPAGGRRRAQRLRPDLPRPHAALGVVRRSRSSAAPPPAAAATPPR